MSVNTEQFKYQVLVTDGTVTQYYPTFVISQNKGYKVYVTPPNTDPDETKQRVDESTYNVCPPLESIGRGSLEFTSKIPAAGSVITVYPDENSAPTYSFSNTTPLDLDNLNDALREQSLAIEQLNYKMNGVALRYDYSDKEASSISNVVPALEPGDMWIGDNGGKVGKTSLTEIIEEVGRYSQFTSPRLVYVNQLGPDDASQPKRINLVDCDGFAVMFNPGLSPEEVARKLLVYVDGLIQPSCYETGDSASETTDYDLGWTVVLQPDAETDPHYIEFVSDLDATNRVLVLNTHTVATTDGRPVPTGGPLMRQDGANFRYTADSRVMNYDLSNAGYVRDVAGSEDTGSFDPEGLARLHKALGRTNNSEGSFANKALDNLENVQQSTMVGLLNVSVGGSSTSNTPADIPYVRGDFSNVTNNESAVDLTGINNLKMLLGIMSSADLVNSVETIMVPVGTTLVATNTVNNVPITLSNFTVPATKITIGHLTVIIVLSIGQDIPLARTNIGAHFIGIVGVPKDTFRTEPYTAQPTNDSYAANFTNDTHWLSVQMSQAEYRTRLIHHIFIGETPIS